MSGDLISRQDAKDAMYQLEAEDIETYGCSIPEGFDAKPAVEALEALPSAEPEQKNQKTALSVQVKVDFDDMIALLEDIKGVLTKHVKAKEVQPERKKGELKTVGFLTCQCSECGAQFHELEYTNFCPNCGAKWSE